MSQYDSVLIPDHSDAPPGKQLTRGKLQEVLVLVSYLVVLDDVCSFCSDESLQSTTNNCSSLFIVHFCLFLGRDLG